jgi:choline-glycine betaine transporter
MLVVIVVYIVIVTVGKFSTRSTETLLVNIYDLILDEFKWVHDVSERYANKNWLFGLFYLNWGQVRLGQVTLMRPESAARAT